MSDVRYEPFKTVAYNPNVNDPVWDRAIEREIANAELRGSIRAFEKNPLVKFASKSRG